jgi:hypothetical protein
VARQDLLGDGGAVDPDPLGHVGAVGRGVEARPESRGLEDGRRQRGDRALPVGAADVDDAELASGGRARSAAPRCARARAASRRAPSARGRGAARGARSRHGGSAGSAKNASRRRRGLAEILALHDAVDHSRARGGTPRAGNPRAGLADRLLDHPGPAKPMRAAARPG